LQFTALTQRRCLGCCRLDTPTILVTMFASAKLAKLKGVAPQSRMLMPRTMSVSPSTTLACTRTSSPKVIQDEPRERLPQVLSPLQWSASNGPNRTPRLKKNPTTGKHSSKRMLKDVLKSTQFVLPDCRSRSARQARSRCSSDSRKRRQLGRGLIKTQPQSD